MQSPQVPGCWEFTQQGSSSCSILNHGGGPVSPIPDPFLVILCPYYLSPSRLFLLSGGHSTKHIVFFPSPGVPGSACVAPSFALTSNNRAAKSEGFLKYCSLPAPTSPLLRQPHLHETQPVEVARNNRIPPRFPFLKSDQL